MSVPNDALAELQIGFAAALHDASHAPALMSHLNLHERLNDRVALYRGNMHEHRRSALANAYPVLLSLVGDAYFDQLSRAYGLAHPSQSGDLNRFGDALSAFVAEYESHARYAYFADMARLEWALHQAYYACDVTPFSADDWTLIGEHLLDAHIAIHPASKVIASRYAIADIWLAHQPGGEYPATIDMPSHSLVVRPGWHATVITQSEAAHHAFVALQQGKTLNSALDAAFAIDEAFDFATQWRIWIETAAVTGTDGVSTL